MRSLGSTRGLGAVLARRPTSAGSYKFRVLGADGVVSDKADPLAFATEVPPATASRVYQRPTRGNDDEWLARARRQQPVFEPMSTYEVHLESWRPGLTYRELADELTAYVVDAGLHPRRVAARDGAPVRRLLGLPGHVVLRADLAARRPGRLPLPRRPAAPGRHRRDPRLGARALPQGRVGAGPIRRHRRSTSTPTPDAASNSTGAPTCSTSAGPRCATSWSPTRSTGCEEFHVDGLRVDAVASMLYLDYSRPDGGWTPNVYGGRENLEAVQFLQEMNATVHKLAPRHRDGRRGVDRMARRHPADQPWRAWLFVQVEHGLDARHPGVHQPGPGAPQLPPPPDDLLAAVRLQRELRAADQPRRGGPRQGHAVGPDARQRPCARPPDVRGLLAYMWAHPGKQLLFMGQEFGQRAEWSEERGLDWYQLGENGFSSGMQRMVRDVNGVYRDATVRCGPATPAPRATPGSTPTTRPTTC